MCLYPRRPPTSTQLHPPTLPQLHPPTLPQLHTEHRDSDSEVTGQQVIEKHYYNFVFINLSCRLIILVPSKFPGHWPPHCSTLPQLHIEIRLCGVCWNFTCQQVIENTNNFVFIKLSHRFLILNLASITGHQPHTAPPSHSSTLPQLHTEHRDSGCVVLAGGHRSAGDWKTLL